MVHNFQILHKKTIAGTEAEYQSDAGFIKDIPYLALMGELSGDSYEPLWENRPCCDGTELYKAGKQPGLSSEKK